MATKYSVFKRGASALFFFFQTLSHASTLTLLSPLQSAKIHDLAQTREWHLLVHYQNGVFGVSSDVASPEFFLAPQGRTQPEQELEATLNAIQLPWGAPSNQHARCLFPARTEWLAKQFQLTLSPMPLLQCPLLHKFVRETDPERIYLVFSSYFVGSPASTFGHTLLRLGHRAEPGRKESNELLDNGVGYAAVATTSNPFIYALFGLTGFFKGEFSRIPYYYKIRQYNDYESRDIWSYELNLTPEERRNLVYHIWEIGNGYFHYYYLTQNCAYHLMTALEAAAPRYHLLERLPYFIIPVDTLRVACDTPGLVKSVSYRPSMRTQFLSKYENLSEQQQALFHLAAKLKSPAALVESPLDAGAKGAILDALADYLDMQYPDEILSHQEEPVLEKRTFLLARAGLHVQSPPDTVVTDVTQSPDRGHGSRRVGLLAGPSTEEPGFMRGVFRFALHDLLDSPKGFAPYSHVEFGHFAARMAFPTHTLFMDDFTVLGLRSLNPLHFYQSPLSWQVNLGGHRVWEPNCNQGQCFAVGLQAGPGLAWEFAHAQLLYGFLSGEIAASSGFFYSWGRAGLGPTIGVLTTLHPSWRLLIEAQYRTWFFSLYPHIFQYHIESRYFVSPQLALNVRGAWYPTRHEGTLGLLYYF